MPVLSKLSEMYPSTPIPTPALYIELVHVLYVVPSHPATDFRRVAELSPARKFSLMWLSMCISEESFDLGPERLSNMTKVFRSYQKTRSGGDPREESRALWWSEDGRKTSGRRMNYE